MTSSYLCRMPVQTYFHWIKAACRHYLKAKTRYDIHSPFLAEWVKDVYEDKRWFDTFGVIVTLKNYWRHSAEKVEYIEDYGAGSKAGQGKIRSVKEMVAHSAIDDSSGRLLFRMANHHKPNSLLELGTNLGFSAIYLRAARRYANFVSIEGHEDVAKLAKQSFKIARLDPPIILNGTFKDQLPIALSYLKEVDFFWLDGDHRSKPTIEYVKEVLPFLKKNSVIVVGDIHWSLDMEAAWEVLKKTPGVSLSLDVFHFGILFLRPEQREVEHFSIVPYWMKPWRMGFF